MKSFLFKAKMAFILALLLPIGALLAQGHTKPTPAKTPIKTTKSTPGTPSLSVLQTPEQTKTEVEAMLKASKSNKDIIGALRGKASTKTIVTVLRNGRKTYIPTGSNPQAPPPVEPTFSAADEADAAEMLLALVGNYTIMPSFDDLNAIHQVYEVPDFAAMLRVWDACFDMINARSESVESPRVVFDLANKMGDWMAFGRGPQWQGQYAAIFDVYFREGFPPQELFYDFTQHFARDVSGLFSITRGERIQQILNAAVAHSGLTERQMLRLVMETRNYIGPTNSAMVRYRGFVAAIQPDFPQTAIFWAEIMKMDNVTNPRLDVFFPSISMTDAIDVLTPIFGTPETVAAVRAVYQ